MQGHRGLGYDLAHDPDLDGALRGKDVDSLVRVFGVVVDWDVLFKQLICVVFF